MMGMAHVVVLAAVLAMAATASSSPEVGVQPLSKIAIHKATVELHGSAYVRASALLLGDGDQQEGDTATVTVEYGWQNPATDDWIAVFSPSDFISGSCPNPRRYPTEPLLCTAPIKYQYANFSANYLYWGKGTIQFQLINQRSDFSFALFTGGLENPKLVGLTKLSPFKNPKAPVFPRLAQGKTHDEMAVTWTSGYDVGEAYPFVEWGMVTSGSGGGNPARTPAGTLTFNRGSMCGAPARTIGWRDPGFIHTAFMRGLWPNKEYFYKVGHELPDGTVVWGKPYTFRAPPTPGQSSLQRVIVFGDMGKAERDGSNEYANYQPGSLNTTDALVKDLDNFDMVFHIGDLPYANGYISQWDQFTAQVAPISARKPYMIASGNHERDWPNTGGFFDVEDSGGECGVLAETMYYYPAENRANFWYKVDYGMFRFCVADSEHDWREGTPQYKFIEECLSTVDRKHQPWLVFAAHRVLGYSSNKWYAEQGSFEEPKGRESLQKLWQRHRVDLAIFGHVHNYERTCPLYQNQCVSNERSRYSGTMNGTIFVVAGGGGSHLNGYTSAVPKWSVFRDRDYGFTKLTAFNHSSLLFEYKRSSDGEVYDNFTIHRDYRDVLGCVHDSCFPTTLAT
ncbi:nucleotide pyrophosphatase/phosphodiesterase [Aegilops tauschii subsp. strangulata]|uniref:Purple acid phosphatase n=3 Tax=Aegilops tauschii subsp. strangulata TaxID=200361 RepID=A0A453QNX8_AEGTS|nr:nucleotide pyrophosphatase/phosphodiesterase [Aegilops tauschii subsp. strangulata]